MFILCITISVVLSGCNHHQLEVIFLGDSIAEGLGGISPLSERERYAYYSVLGIRNEYIYRNRAVSGHRSMDMLELIQREDTDIKMIKTHIKNADIIHVSIIGNDLLYNDLGQVMVAWVKNDYSVLSDTLEIAKNNFYRIVSLLKEYNPNATMFFQNVYNPVFGKTWLISQESYQQLSALGIDETEYREIGASILNKFNGVLTTYLKDNPGDFYLIDAFSEFERIYQQNPARGARLVCRDGVHPSIEGHAVLADLTQTHLERLKLASKSTALRKYKNLRKKQLKQLYGNSVNLKEINTLINKADTCSKVTEEYFLAILDKQPKY